jgi:predicted ATPase/DNA-binding SARP family transcriptional activator
MAALWRVRMLGGFWAESDQVTVKRFRTRRVAALLAYLAYYRDRTASREELCEMLWPDMEPERAKRNLRQALSSLRHHLEPPGVPPGAVLETLQSNVRLNPEYVVTDVEAFRREADPVAAIELYQGDLLPGFYEDWVHQERLRLEDEYVAHLQSCLRTAEGEGRLDDAIRYARLALAKDAFSEDLHESLIRLYQASGRPASAEAQRTELRQLFDEKPAAPRPAPIVALKPVEEARTWGTVRLPIQLTRYFGRDRERSFASDALRERRTRLLTLTGPAGTGKTRLSIETGRTLTDEYGWNVWFVPLADVSDGTGLLDAVAEAVQIPGSESEPLDALADRLAEGDNLLILDNLEHIVEDAAPLVAAILARVPNVSLLATSRQSLKLEGEQELDLGTLPVPPEEEAPLADLIAIPSVGLFVDRARSALPDFTLTAHNAGAIMEICRKLDGLPLALEIAAGLAGTFSPGQLLQNLDGRLELLRSRRRDLNSRHRSLRAAIDYSYHLLDERLQTFFVRLSVFRGGFTVEAAGEVCEVGMGLSGRRRYGEALRLILDLQERSLLRAEETKEGAPARFRLLESYREYAAELLDAEAHHALRRRHAAYFLGQEPADIRPEDRDNRIAAVRFLHEDGATTKCLDLLLTFDSFSRVAHDVVLSLARSERLGAFSPLDQARIFRLATDAHIHRSDFEQAYQTGRRAVEIAAANGLDEENRLDRRKLALVLAYLGRREESIVLSEENLAEARARGDLFAIETACSNIGANYWALGKLEEARAAYENAHAASLELRSGRPYWPVLYNLSLVYLDLGLLDDGLAVANEGLRITQADDEPFGVSMCLFLVSRYHRYRGNLPAALSTNYEALVRRRKIGFLYWTFQAIFAHAVILAAMGRNREAVILIAAARVVQRINEREYRQIQAQVREAVGEVEYERAWAEGLGMGLDEAFRLAARFH